MLLVWGSSRASSPSGCYAPSLSDGLRTASVRPAAQRGFEATADVAVVGPGLKVLDADLAFEVGGSYGGGCRCRACQR